MSCRALAARFCSSSCSARIHMGRPASKPLGANAAGRLPAHSPTQPRSFCSRRSILNEKVARRGIMYCENISPIHSIPYAGRCRPVQQTRPPRIRAAAQISRKGCETASKRDGVDGSYSSSAMMSWSRTLRPQFTCRLGAIPDPLGSPRVQRPPAALRSMQQMRRPWRDVAASELDRDANRLRTLSGRARLTALTFPFIDFWAGT